MKYTGQAVPRHRLISLLFLVFLLSLSAAGASALTLTCIVPDGQYVNVRNQASSSAAIWGVMHHGDVIHADPAEIENGFFKTTFDGRTAYVSVKFYEIAEDRDYRVEANGRVRVRKSPGGAAAGFIKPGRTVHVTAWRYAADGSRWAQYTGGKYISAEYLVPET
ncbi:MAG: hypothetical protein IJD60_10285 [Clostridia bacterium]|nr:hypothetical protein [Clostridia bacterium]